MALHPPEVLQSTCVAPVKLTPTDSIIAILTEAQTVSDGFPCRTFGLRRIRALDTQHREFPSVSPMNCNLVPARSKQNIITSPSDILCF